MRPDPCGETGRSCWNSSGNSTWSGGGRCSRILAMHRRGLWLLRQTVLRSRPSWGWPSWPAMRRRRLPLMRSFWVLRVWSRAPNPQRERDRPSTLHRARKSFVGLRYARMSLFYWLFRLVWLPTPRIPRAWAAENPLRAVYLGRASTGQFWPVVSTQEGVDHRTSVHSLSSRLWFGGTDFLVG